MRVVHRCVPDAIIELFSVNKWNHLTCACPFLQQVDSENFIPLLQRLDECLSFINSRPQYAEYAAYSLKCGQLRGRALSAVRSHVFATLRGAVTQVRRHAHDDGDNSSISVDGGDASPLTEGALTSVFYVKFRSSISCLRPIMEEMDTRARLSVAACSRREYAQVIADCRAIYCEQRLALILGFVQKRLMVSLLPGKLSMPNKSLHEFLSLSNVHAGIFE